MMTVYIRCEQTQAKTLSQGARKSSPSACFVLSVVHPEVGLGGGYDITRNERTTLPTASGEPAITRAAE